MVDDPEPRRPPNDLQAGIERRGMTDAATVMLE
jgi:hypothetical protein